MEVYMRKKLAGQKSVLTCGWSFTMRLHTFNRLSLSVSSQSPKSRMRDSSLLTTGFELTVYNCGKTLVSCKFPEEKIPKKKIEKISKKKMKKFRNFLQQYRCFGWKMWCYLPKWRARYRQRTRTPKRAAEWQSETGSTTYCGSIPHFPSAKTESQLENGIFENIPTQTSESYEKFCSKYLLGIAASIISRLL